ncbi:MAG TPA: DcaP family trimeric outer membrane transporter [Stenotrophomonas sp.]|nr:DcaP family trimeric outer membrane transporter [Stenotrophomonas sp.]
MTLLVKPLRHSLCLLLAAAATAPALAQAQTTDAQRDAEIAQLRQTVSNLMQRIEVLEAERGTTPPAAEAAVRSPVPGSPGSPPSPPPSAPPTPQLPSLAALDIDASPLPPHDTFDEDEQSSSRADNDAAPGDNLEGFFLVPGANTWLRLSGYAKLDAMMDDDDAGDSDMFITSDIPVGAQHGDSRFNMHARQTRFTLEARRETSAGQLRFLLQNDFFGSGGSYGYRLRHAWGQLGNTYAGFGWSAFMDLDSGPDTLDFAGPGAAPSARQASIRQYFPLANGNQIILAAEHRSGELRLADADARERMAAPNVVLAARHEADWGNVQLAGLLRYLSYDASARSDSTLAGGAALSGSWGADSGDYLVYGVLAGQGIAAYVGDLGGLDLDAVVDPAGSLQALREWGGWIGYTHLWTGRWRSTLTYGRLYLERDAALDPSAFRRSDYAAVNLIYAPAPSWSWGVELLYGKLQQQDGEDGDAMRLQTSLKYDFIR